MEFTNPIEVSVKDILGEDRHCSEIEAELIQKHGFPPSLAKAVIDPFDYVLGLRNGSQIFFSSANYIPESLWVHLSMQYAPDHDLYMPKAKITIPFERGVDIRLSDIAWCADAPFGS